MTSTIFAAEATSVGLSAARVLDQTEYGEVLAVFRRSFYLRFDEDLVCIGSVELDPGPLNILYPTRHHALWYRRLSPGMRARCTARHVTVEDVCRFDCSHADVWRPLPPRQIDFVAIHEGLVRLACEVKTCSPRGLGALIAPLLEGTAPPSGNLLLKAAYPPMQRLLAVLFDLDRHQDIAAVNIAHLIGLGPGLTPSGDDFLGGAMAALHFLGQGDHASRIATIVLRAARADTNLISRAHLQAAARGEMSAPLWDVLMSLHDAGLKLSAALARVAAIGHTSGWDALTGAAAVLRVVCQRRRS